MAVNAHRAFYNSTDESYERNLRPDPEDIDELRDARDKARETLKAAFSEWEKRMDAATLFEDSLVKAFSAGATPPTLSPKFRGQGSYVYGTLNRPAHCPPQEMDFDDGMFLPTSFISQNGEIHPAVASSGYFRLVEDALKPLCDKQGWTLNPERVRPSCVRISLNNGKSHLDIALYAIPDDQYHLLLEKAVRASALTFTDASEASEALFTNIYDTIPVNQIMLAHRDEGWKVSDPRKLERWFVKKVSEHGEQLRRVIRYLKGWRDNNWENCRLSSIALMACIVRFYDESTEDFVGRDDAAINGLAARLPDMLAGGIENPVVDGRLDEGWDDGDNPCRTEFVAEAIVLRDQLGQALSASKPDAAVRGLVGTFGDHFPTQEALVSIEGQAAMPSIVSAGVLGSLGSSDDAQSSVKIDGDNRFG